MTRDQQDQWDRMIGDARNNRLDPNQLVNIYFPPIEQIVALPQQDKDTLVDQTKDLLRQPHLTTESQEILLNNIKILLQSMPRNVQNAKNAMTDAIMGLIKSDTHKMIAFPLYLDCICNDDLLSAYLKNKLLDSDVLDSIINLPILDLPNNPERISQLLMNRILSTEQLNRITWISSLGDYTNHFGSIFKNIIRHRQVDESTISILRNLIDQGHPIGSSALINDIDAKADQLEQENNDESLEDYQEEALHASLKTIIEHKLVKSKEGLKELLMNTIAKADLNIHALAEKVGVDWSKVDFTPGDLMDGYRIELEHGIVHPETNVTDDDPVKTIKIALVHLNESKEYYKYLAQMEEHMKKSEDIKGPLLPVTMTKAVENTGIGLSGNTKEESQSIK